MFKIYIALLNNPKDQKETEESELIIKILDFVMIFPILAGIIYLFIIISIQQACSVMVIILKFSNRVKGKKDGFVVEMLDWDSRQQSSVPGSAADLQFNFGQVIGSLSLGSLSVSLK